MLLRKNNGQVDDGQMHNPVVLLIVVVFMETVIGAITRRRLVCYNLQSVATCLSISIDPSRKEKRKKENR